MDAHDKEKAQQEAIEKMLGRALRRDVAAGAESCPAADVLAAYHEQSLETREKEQVEAHLDGCFRCQEVLAAFALSEPVPAEEFEPAAAAAAAKAEVSPVYAAARPVAARAWHEEPQREKAVRFVFPWRWLAPAASFAAAAALCIALGSQQGPLEIARLTFEKPMPSIATPGAAEGVTIAKAEEAKNEIAANAVTREQEKPRAPAHAAKERVAANAGEGSGYGLGMGARVGVSGGAIGGIAGSPEGGKAKRAEESGDVSAKAATPPASLAGAAPPTANAPNKLADEKREALSKSETSGKTAGAPGPSTAGQFQVPQTLVQSSAQPLQASSAEAASRSRMGSAVGGVASARKAAFLKGELVASPEPAVLWRVGAAGKIEHTTDGGQTWQAQLSGTDADLTAGSAPSAKVCWVVGAAGTILRTIDGEHWQKIAPPETPAPIGWVRVSATDAQNAVITSADGKRFATTDGGKTWKSQ